MHIKQPSFALGIIAFSLASAMAHAENVPTRFSMNYTF